MDHTVLEFLPHSQSAPKSGPSIQRLKLKQSLLKQGLPRFHTFARAQISCASRQNKAAEGFDPAMIADREAETVIRERIKHSS